jgi:hypothetical protein
MIINPYVFGGFDADAQAFITAAGITDNTQKTAINTLVVDMKGYGIWTKMKAIYPFVGGTATTHKWNLKDPLDTNAAFRLVFSGGWTHSANGALPNGTNAYADTFLNPTGNLTINNAHLSYYSRTDVNLTQIEIGSLDSSSYIIIEARTANQSYFAINTNILPATSDTNSAAFYIANRTASNVTNGFRNSTKIFNSTTASNTLVNKGIFIGAMQNNSNVAQFYSSKQCAFASIGDGLTDTEAANFYTAVQNFNTTLTRNV